MDESKPEPIAWPDRLWWLTLAPGVWAIHFLATYLTCAIHCAKFADSDGDASEVRFIVAGLTLVAIGLISWVGGISHRRHRTGEATLPHDFDSQEDQRRFLGFAALLLSLLSGVATLFTAMVFIFLGTCH
ncbi:MAG: transmembrane prediction [Pirellulaceae bacterium]